LRDTFAMSVNEESAASETGRGRRKHVPIWLWIAALLLVTIPFLYVGLFINLRSSARDFYEYRVGTPTTATIDHWDSDSRGTATKFYGRWSIGGVSQIGPIEGEIVGDPKAGSSVDVHVRGGTAYTDPVGQYFYWNIFYGLAQTAAGLGVLWILWRIHTTGKFFWIRFPDRT
jgi:hypothetical protein